MDLEELKEKGEYFIRMKEGIEANPEAWVKKNSQGLAEHYGEDVKEVVKNWEYYANVELHFINVFMFSMRHKFPVMFSAASALYSTKELFDCPFTEDQRSKDV